MRLRNQLLALFFLGLFLAAGVWYFGERATRKPFGIVLVVSDSFTAGQVAGARLYAGGADHRLSFDSMPQVALARNAARDFAIADGSAATTALATGERASHRQLSVDSRGAALRTLIELARAEGRAAGIVSNGRLADPGAAGFYAHHADGREAEALAAQFVETRLEVALGGGAEHFLPLDGNGRRKDGRNLLMELRSQGRVLVQSKAELENADVYHRDGLVGFFGNGPLAFQNQAEVSATQPTLADLTRRAIEVLQASSRRGYLLVVESALPRLASEMNQGERMLQEALATDEALAVARLYAGPQSLVVASGRQSTGGFDLNGYPLRQDRGLAITGTNPSGYPWITWSTGPNGGSETNSREPSAAWQAYALPTVEDVLVAADGPGAEEVQGVVDLTRVFELLRGQL